jgi:hypothetical protein
MNEITEIFKHYKKDPKKDYKILDYRKTKSYDAFPEPYREEYYDEYTILFMENFDIRCIEVTIINSTQNVYVKNIPLEEARNIFDDENISYMIDLHLFSEKECEDKDHIMVDNKKKFNHIH